jgi:predicted transcriptional regulator
MEKRTIAEIAVDILKAANEPLTISEITQAFWTKA